MSERLRALALGLIATALFCSPSSDQPVNVLLLVLDTTRADAVSIYGEGPANTPTLDGLAREGVVFTHARGTSAWTVPAHGSLFTGLYPSRHGAHAESEVLAEDRTTLAELLAPTHETAGFSENPHIIRAKGYAQGFETYEETWRRRPSVDEEPVTLDLLEAWFDERDPERPFFLFVNLMTPHLPYRPSTKWERAFLPADVTVEEIERHKAFGEGQAREFMAGVLPLDERRLEILRGLYRADVSFADERSGRILEMLRERDELDRTLVVVVGDHGENIGDHGLMEHQLCLYESLLRVPLVFRLPGAVSGGVRDAAPVQLVDVPPTILRLAGVALDRLPAMEGRDVFLDPPPPDRPVLAEYMRPLSQRPLFERAAPGFDFSPFDRRLRSIQVGTHKLIASDRGDLELYDLDADPHETRNLAGEQRELARVLLARLKRWSESGDSGPPPAPPELDPEALEALRSLGYID